MQDQIQAAHLAAIAQGGMPLGLPAGMLLDGSQGQERSAGRRLVRRAYRRLARTVAALWDGLPGPWPVKAILIAVAIIEPGPFGEMALGAYATFMAARKARRTA